MAAKQKYPFTLLTNDYGILNDHDLALYSYIRNINPAAFFEQIRSTIFIGNVSLAKIYPLP